MEPSESEIREALGWVERLRSAANRLVTVPRGSLALIDVTYGEDHSLINAVTDSLKAIRYHGYAARIRTRYWRVIKACRRLVSLVDRSSDPFQLELLYQSGADLEQALLEAENAVKDALKLPRNETAGSAKGETEAPNGGNAKAKRGTERGEAPAGFGWYTQQQVADYVGVTVRTVHNWVTGRTGKLVVQQEVGNQYLLSHAELEKKKEAQAAKEVRTGKQSKTSH
ncbi:MAG: helix-turn-helix domain-containing protein [Thermoguttaceae bacterium]